MDTKALRYCLRFLPDEPYLKICYRLKTHKRLELKNPKTFNEKMQWLKLYNRDPAYTLMVDKYRVREYIGRKIGEEYLIPLVGGPYYNANEIDFGALPERFVLKCNHDSGSVVICRDRADFDPDAAREKLDYCLRHNFWYLGREWPYKDVEPCIIAEEYMADESGGGLKDYKVFCFHGTAELIQVDIGRFVNHRRNLYSRNWERINAALEYPAAPEITIDKPERLSQMIQIAEKLSKGIPFLRVDFYSIESHLFFGELTFYSESGFGKFYPEQYERILGEKIDLDFK